MVSTHLLAAKATVAATHSSLLNQDHVVAMGVVPDKVSNPLHGVNPSLTIFGATFKGKTQIILGGIWMLALLGCTAYFLLGSVGYARAKKIGHSDDLGEGAEKMQHAAIAFGICVAAPIILGGIIKMFG